MRVTNLSEDAQEADLRDLFGFFGQIRRIFLAKDKITQQSKVEGEDETSVSSLGDDVWTNWTTGLMMPSSHTLLVLHGSQALSHLCTPSLVSEPGWETMYP